jgi:heme/copper-type cytochrome/quinol oxidase subunit 4
MRTIVGSEKLKGRGRPLEGPTHTWMNYIKMDLTETVYEFVYWIHLDQDSDKGWALVNMVMNLLVP